MIVELYLIGKNVLLPQSTHICRRGNSIAFIGVAFIGIAFIGVAFVGLAFIGLAIAAPSADGLANAQKCSLLGSSS